MKVRVPFAYLILRCDLDLESREPGLDRDLRPRQDTKLSIRRADGRTQEVALRVRIDTPIEVDYYRHGGILPFVLRQLIG